MTKSQEKEMDKWLYAINCKVFKTTINKLQVFGRKIIMNQKLNKMTNKELQKKADGFEQLIKDTKKFLNTI